MQCLVIGYGSIGKRHAHGLQHLGCQIHLVTAQKIADYVCYTSLEQALEKNHYDHVIIANATHLHYDTLIRLIQCNYTGVVLVEKPLFAKVEALPVHSIKHILVAYNLRFHELLLQLKKMLAGEKILTFSAYVGQYLPTWRQDTDYRLSYSSKQELGGGVLRDLSHELDYSTWLCGPTLEVTALGGRFSSLEINSDDAYAILMKCKSCPLVNLQLNYLDRKPKRDIIINTEAHTFFIDLINGSLSVNGEVKIQCSKGGKQTYTKQHEALLSQDVESFCHYEDGLYVMKLIEAIETASTKSWRTM